MSLLGYTTRYRYLVTLGKRNWRSIKPSFMRIALDYTAGTRERTCAVTELVSEKNLRGCIDFRGFDSFTLGRYGIFNPLTNNQFLSYLNLIIVCSGMVIQEQDCGLGVVWGFLGSAQIRKVTHSGFYHRPFTDRNKEMAGQWSTSWAWDLVCVFYCSDYRRCLQRFKIIQ